MPQAKPGRAGSPADGTKRWFHAGDPAPTTDLGTAIKLRRTELGLSRRELAERAGLSYPYVAELENGTKQGSPKALEAIATALELRPAELLAWSDDLAESRGLSPSDPQHWRNRRPAPTVVAAATAPLDDAAMAAPVVSRRAGPGGRHRLSPEELAGRIAGVLANADPDDAEAALLLVLGEERVRSIVRDELDRREAGRRG